MTPNFYHKQTGTQRNRRDRVLVIDEVNKPVQPAINTDSKPEAQIRKSLKTFLIVVVFMIAFMVISIKILEYMWGRRDQAIYRSTRTGPQQTAPAILSPMAAPKTSTEPPAPVNVADDTSSISRERDDRLETIYRWGKVLEEAGELEGALDRYQEALNIDPENIAVLSQVGRLNIQLARYGTAVRALEIAYRKNPNNPDIINDLGVAMTFNNQAGEAIPLFDQLIEKFPDYIPALFNKSYALVQIREYEPARPLLEQYLEKKPEDAMALGVLAVLDMANKDYDNALKRLDQAISIAPKWSMPYLDAATICATIDQPARAIDYLERALAFAPPSEVYQQYQSTAFRTIRITEEGRALEKKIADRARELMK